MAGDVAAEALAWFQAAWNAAGRNWDVTALAALFADDALFYGGRPALFTGPHVRDYFASYEGLIASGAMELVDQHCIVNGGDQVIAQGRVKFDILMTDGRRAPMELRTSLVLERRGRAWICRAHHFGPVPPASPLPD